MRYWLLFRVLPAVADDFHKSAGYKPMDDFGRHEAKSMNLVGLDLCFNHHQHLKTGKTVHQYDGDDGAKYCIAYVDTERALGKLTKKLISSELTQLRDVSLSHKAVARINWSTGKLDVEKTPIEISLVPEGRREPGKAHRLASFSTLAD